MRLMPGKKAADAGLKRCTELVEEFPHSAQARFLKALAHFSSQPPDYTQSLDELGRALALDSEHIHARELRVEVYQAAGRHDQAEAECRTLLDKQPESIMTMLVLGDLMQARNAPEAEYRDLAKKFDQNPAAGLLLAMAIHRDNPARAEELANKALGGDPDWRLLKAYAGFLAARGGAGKVVQRLAVYAQANPDSPDALRTLASVQAAAGDLASAAESQHNAYALGGRSYHDLQLLVSILVQNEKPDEALAVIAKHRKQRPDDSAATLLMARLYGRLNKIDDTVELLTDLLNQEPENVDANIVIGTAYLLRRQYDDAARHYESVLLQDPANHTAANNLAYILAEFLDRPRDAARVILPVLQRYPRSASVQDTWGWIQYKLGRLTEAMAALNLSLRLEPDDPLSHYHAAVVCNQLEQNERARELLERALALDPDFDKAEQARKLLDSLR